jgi:gamma-glutamylputrescine oxidase
MKRDVGQIQTFLAISCPLGDAAMSRLFPAGPRLVWEARLLYHYARPVPGGRLLVGGSSLARTYSRRADHDAAGTARRLGAWVARRFPGLAIRWAAAWPGFLGVTRDFLPLAGEVPEMPGVHAVTAATGLPWCAALGSALAEGLVDGVDRVPPELSTTRAFRLGATSRWLGTPATLALAHALEKLS